MSNKLQFLKDLDDYYLNDIIKLVENDKKLVASIGEENPFANLTTEQQSEIAEVFKEKGIKTYSTKPYVRPGQFKGLTIYWKPKELQKALDENIKILEKSFVPRISDDFAVCICHNSFTFEEYPDLFKFISILFYDERFV